MSAEQEQYELICRREFEHINRKLDRLDEAVRGNGKPGIMLRLDRLEASEAVRRRLVWLMLAAVVTLLIGTGWRLLAGT